MRVVLRERLSRGGHPLRQTLQIFRRVRLFASSRTVVVRASGGHEWRSKWHRFKAELPHQRGEMARRNWGHPLHSLCSYQGKLKPAIAHLLVDAFVRPGGRMLDPFAEVGTIPLEAALSDRTAFAFDISPPALQITRAKLATCNSADCEAIIAELGEALAKFRLTETHRRRVDAIRFNGPLGEYFDPETLREVIGAREYFLRHPPATPAAVDDLFVVAAYPARQPALCAEPHVTPYYTICPLRAEHISGASATAPGEGWPELGARSRGSFHTGGGLRAGRDHALA